MSYRRYCSTLAAALAVAAVVPGCSDDPDEPFSGAPSGSPAEQSPRNTEGPVIIGVDDDGQPIYSASAVGPASGTMAAPSGTMAPPSGTMADPSGTMAPPSGTMAAPSGTMAPPSGTMADPSGTMAPPSGTMAAPSGTFGAP